MNILRPLAIVLVGSVVAIGAAIGAAQVPADRTGYEVPGESTFPEGIAHVPSHGAVFVTGAGSGGIYRIDLETGSATTLFEPGRRDPFTTIGLAVDEQDRLWVAGGSSGEILRFDELGGGEPRQDPDLVISTAAAAGDPFLNDLVVAPNGDVYVTDSSRPLLFRVPAGAEEAEAWVDFTGTDFEYQEGFNANGIAITEDGGHLIIVAANTGMLYRVDVETREVSTIDVDGGPLTGGDGLVLDGRTLYVVQNGPDRVAVVALDEALESGTVERTIDDERLASAATAALVGDALLVVNAQFAAMETGPELPFTIAVLDAGRR